MAIEDQSTARQATTVLIHLTSPVTFSSCQQPLSTLITGTYAMYS